MLWKGGAAARTTASLVVVTPLLKQSVMQVQHQMLPLECTHACRRRECTSGGLQRGWGQVIAKAAGSDAGMCEVAGETNVHPRKAISQAPRSLTLSHSRRSPALLGPTAPAAPQNPPRMTRNRRQRWWQNRQRPASVYMDRWTHGSTVAQPKDIQLHEQQLAATDDAGKR